MALLNNYRKNSQKGLLLIELLLVIALSSILLPAILVGIVASRDGKAQAIKRVEAVGILKNSVEVLRIMRDRDWDLISTNGTYHLEKTQNFWTLDQNPVSRNGYTETITITDAIRDGAGALAQSGNADQSTKKITVSVNWFIPILYTVSQDIYLSRYANNTTRSETTQTEFDRGTKSGTAVRATYGSGLADDGEVVLGSGGRADWCNPSLASGGLNLSGNGEATAISATEGKAFIATGQNASGMDALVVNISNPPFPQDPVATQQAVFDGNLKSNEIFGDVVSGITYQYIATNNNQKEVVILRVEPSSFTELSSINLPGSQAASSVYVSNNMLYVTDASNLYAYDITNRSLPAYRGAIGLAAPAKRVIVNNYYAFIALNSTLSQLQIIDVTNPAAMVSRSTLQLNSQPANAIFVNSSGDRAYIANNSGSGNDVFIINTSNKSSPAPVAGGAFDTGIMVPTGIVFVGGNRIIVVGKGGTPYQVFAVDNEQIPQLCGSLSMADGINGIAAVREADGDVYSYLITTNQANEFRIVFGPGGAYINSGTFESGTLDLASSSAVNRFYATFVEPVGSNITFQVSVAADQSGVCPSTGYTFLGPDNTSNTYFNPASGDHVSIPFASGGGYQNPGRCFRYKAFFSTSTEGSSPVLKDFTISYTP